MHQRLGAENPFEHIRMLSRLASDLSIGDWDGDGDLDVLHSNPLSPVQYFEQSEGQLVLLEGPKSPFYEIANLTVTHRPIMADWNGDGNMDLVLLAKFVGTSDIDQNSLCTSYLCEQHKIGGKTALVFKDETFSGTKGAAHLMALVHPLWMWTRMAIWMQSVGLTTGHCVSTITLLQASSSQTNSRRIPFRWT